MTRTMNVTSKTLAMVWLFLITTTAVRADVSVDRAVGQPEVKESDARGYFVWKDGDTWKVRWANPGEPRRFTGQVTVDDGGIETMTPFGMDTERRVAPPGRDSARERNGRQQRRNRDAAAAVAGTQEDTIEHADVRTIRFAATTATDAEGFDFKVTSNTNAIRLTFDVDGKRQPGSVRLGREAYAPSESPVVIRLRGDR